MWWYAPVVPAQRKQRIVGSRLAGLLCKILFQREKEEKEVWGGHSVEQHAPCIISVFNKRQYLYVHIACLKAEQEYKGWPTLRARAQCHQGMLGQW